MSTDLSLGLRGSGRDLRASVRECPSTAPYDLAVPKKIVHDYRSMTISELRDLARKAHRQEETARYAKGRRTWKSAWQAAEDELRRRGVAERD
jgi:hypothetical protein